VRCVVDGKRAQEKFLNHPNLHALLHLKGTARDFGSLRNVGGAVGEAKHKPFKAQAMLSNFRQGYALSYLCISEYANDH